MLAAVGGDTTTIALSPSGSQTNPSDEWARFMKRSTLGVVTYTIDVDPGTSGQGPGWTKLLKSMASVSSGKYYAVSSGTNSGSQIATAITDALSEIQSVNSVFASVSLPMSVNSQETYSDQVFVGLFRPDPDANPRWMGNIKQYQLNTSLRLVDADGNLAVNSQTGFITACARSFWTPTTADTYWAFSPEGDCIPPSVTSPYYYADSNYPDGNIVEKGAQAYVLRSSSNRTMYTCSPVFNSCSSFTSFDTSNSAITPALLGVANSTTAASLIAWERGLDMLDENNNGITNGEMRPSAHGDVVHSRPAAINYGTLAAPQVVVYYGSNDGVFHAINGSQTSTFNGVAPGGELWSFVPPEFYGNIGRLYYNTPVISFPNVTDPTALPKPYGIDGPVTTYADGTHTYVYAPMRRGGRVIYAFDVSVPASPKLLWKVGCPSNIPKTGSIDDTGCTAGMSGMGQAWSAASVLKATGYGSGASPMIITGGGYDTCEDADPNTCTSSEKGANVYVLDATTGALLKTLPTDRAVAADVFVLTGINGLASYAYAVDLGGNVYRITIGTAAPASWTITKIAALGCSTAMPCSANRKFMAEPDVVVSNGINMLMVGSGDREKPLLYTSSGNVVNSVRNYFFRIDDNPASATWLTSEAGACGTAIICLNSLEAITPTSTGVEPETIGKKGWSYALRSTEQVVSAAITIFGDVKFYTHLPPTPASTTECTSTLGTTYLYSLWYGNAAGQLNGNGSTSNRELITGGGLPPAIVAGLVSEMGANGSSVTAGFEIGGCDSTDLSACKLTPPASAVAKQPKSRVYWYLQR
jgi:type IV pilus assembly protein PilY1